MNFLQFLTDKFNHSKWPKPIRPWVKFILHSVNGEEILSKIGRKYNSVLVLKGAYVG